MTTPARLTKGRLFRGFFLVDISPFQQFTPRLRHLEQTCLVARVRGFCGKSQALFGVLEIVIFRRHAD
jgi:hypothetical protein